MLSRQDNSKMSCRYLENVLSRQDNSKTILRCLEDVLCRLGWQELQLLLLKSKGYELKLVQVARHLMMVDCLQFPVFVVQLDFAVF